MKKSLIYQGVELILKGLQEEFGIDVKGDVNFRETASRVYRAYKEVLSGSVNTEAQLKKILEKVFPEKYSDAIVVKDIKAVGMCLDAKTPVALLRGSTWIDFAKEGEEIIGFAEDGRVVINKITKITRVHRTSALQIHLDKGRWLDLSPEHPILTPLGWKRAGEIREGDKVFYFSRSQSRRIRLQIRDGLREFRMVPETRTVVRIYKTSFRGRHFIDLTCEPYPNYLAGGYIVHNCPHHLMVVRYNVDIAYQPDGWVLGASKLVRLVKLLAARPVLQERFTHELVTFLKEHLRCKGAMSRVVGSHSCMRDRGVLTDATFTTFASSGTLSNRFDLFDGRREK